MTHGLKNIERDCQRLFGLKSLGLRRQHLQRGFPGASGVKNLPAMQETRVQSLGWEDPLEESMATHSGILAWRIPCTEETGELQSVAPHRVGQDRNDQAAAALTAPNNYLLIMKEAPQMKKQYVLGLTGITE